MKNLIYSTSVIFFIFAFSSIVGAFAVPSIYVTEMRLEKNVFSAGEFINGTFIVESGEPEAVSDLSYSVGLIQKYTDNAAEVFVNEVNSAEKFFLRPGEKIEKEFTYKIPKNLADGRYGLRIQLITGKGIPLGWNDYFINVENGGNFILLTSPWVIDGGVKYDAAGGRSFDKDEAPIIEFLAVNQGSESVTAKPLIKIFRRHANLALLKTYEEKEFSLEPQKALSIQYLLPEMETPESYLAELVLADRNNNPISNILNFRWVISGMSAEILSLISSAPSKSDCDTQRLVVSYVGPADPEVSGGKANLIVKIIDNGEIIGQAQKEIQLEAGETEFVVDAGRCVEAPQITAEIVKDGTLLDSYTITQPPRPTQKLSEMFSKRNLIILGLFLAILAIILIVIKKAFRKNTTIPPVPTALLILIGAGVIAGFGLPLNVSADVVVVDSGPEDGTIIAWNSPRHNSIYKPGETFITFSGRIWIGSCVNALLQNKATFYLTDKNGGNRVVLGSIAPPDVSTGELFEYNQSFLFPEVNFTGEGRAYVEYSGRHGTTEDKHLHWITAYEHILIVPKMKNQPPVAICGPATNITADSATLNWSYADPDRNPQGGSQVQAGKDSNFLNLIYNQFILSNANYAVLRGLNPSETYYWRVRVSDDQAGISNWANCGRLNLVQPYCYIDPRSANIKIGDKMQYRAYYDPDGSGPSPRQEVTNTAFWSTGNKAIAVVNNSGLVTGKGVGFTQVKAVCPGNITAQALAVVYSGVPGGLGVCGNNIVEAGEQCDGSDLGGFTCNSLGFIKGGNLRCSANCVFDVSGCIYTIEETFPR
jgi:hypothetical protein